MPTARTREFSTIYFCCAAAAGAVLLPLAAMPATAQSASIADPAAHCSASFKDMKDRVACLEQAIAGLLHDDRCRAVDLSQLMDTPSEMAREKPVNEDEPAEDYAVPTGLGAERVELPREIQKREDKKKKEAETLNAYVEKLVRTSRGTYIFYLDNGQVWRQKESDSVRNILSTKRNYDATISTGVLSGYRLKLKGVPRQMLVDRVE